MENIKTEELEAKVAKMQNVDKIRDVEIEQIREKANSIKTEELKAKVAKMENVDKIRDVEIEQIRENANSIKTEELKAKVAKMAREAHIEHLRNEAIQAERDAARHLPKVMLALVHCSRNKMVRIYRVQN